MNLKKRIALLIVTFALAIAVGVWPDLFRSPLGLAGVILALAIYLFLTIPSYEMRKGKNQTE